MHAFSPLRLELRHSRASEWLSATLGLLAVLAILLSNLSAFAGAALLALAVLVAWRELRQPQPTRVRWNSDGTVWLDWADGSERAVTPLTSHRVGLLTVLVLRDQDAVRRVTLWPSTLSAEDRKSLRRRLRAGQRLADSG